MLYQDAYETSKEPAKENYDNGNEADLEPEPEPDEDDNFEFDINLFVIS